MGMDEILLERDQKVNESTEWYMRNSSRFIPEHLYARVQRWTAIALTAGALAAMHKKPYVEIPLELTRPTTSEYYGQ